MRKNPLAVILLTVLVDMIGIGILIPVIPQLLANPLSSHYLLGTTDVATGFLILGALTAVYPFMSFLSAPILGQISDRVGRRKVLAVCLAGTAVGYALFAIAILLHNLPLLFISRIIDGITGGNISVAQAAVADITKPEDRAKNFGLLGAMFGFGFIAGPFIGGKLADPTFVHWFNATTPFWFAALLAAVNLLFVLFAFPETHVTSTASKAFRWAQSLTDIGSAWKWKEMRNLFIAAFLFYTGFSFFVSFYNVFLTENFGYTEGQIGNYFAYVGLFIVLSQALITRAAAKRWKGSQILRYSMLGTALTVAATVVVREAWQLYLIPPFMAAANGLSFANLTGAISMHASPERQGEILGLNASIQSLSNALPPLLAGAVAARYTPSMPIVIGSFVCAAGWAMYLHTASKHREA